MALRWRWRWRSVLPAAGLQLSQLHPCHRRPQVSLAFKPAANVTAQVRVPFAWNGRLLADALPDRMTFTPDKFDWYQTLTIQPSSLSTGSYFIEVGAGQPAGMPDAHLPACTTPPRGSLSAESPQQLP